MTRRVLISVGSLFVFGCFSPTTGGETDDPSAETSSSGTDAPSGMSTTEGPEVTSGTAEPPTTGATTETSTTMGPSTGDAEPICGDGNVDDGEACDDGVENNGLDQRCLPDCNLNVCGDGNLGPDEFCDDGEDDNVLEVGACAPDCSTVIEEKAIVLSSTFSGGGDLPENAVAYADSQCPDGYRALFSVAGVRQASTGTPFVADDLIDWPLRPYTAYVRSKVLIWMTDETPLLGVRDGSATPLENSISPPCDPGETCALGRSMLTGLDSDWTTETAANCNGWTSSSGSDPVQTGVMTSTVEFLDGRADDCALDALLSGAGFYCVEQ